MSDCKHQHINVSALRGLEDEMVTCADCGAELPFDFETDEARADSEAGEIPC